MRRLDGPRQASGDARSRVPSDATRESDEHSRGSETDFGAVMASQGLAG